jgi:hypothetical protein
MGLQPHTGTPHIGNINSLKLPGLFISDTREKKFLNRTIRRLDEKLLRSSENYRAVRISTSGRYQARDLGYEPDAENVRNLRRLSGYFQTWRYFDRYQERVDELFILKQPTEWFLKLSRQCEERGPIALHIRRGDYTKLKNEFGLLSSEYYRKAIELLDAKDEISEIWVFSDEVETAKKLLKSLNSYNIKYVSPPITSQPVESLILMSKCKSIVIANSTFSYWAAITGKADRLVIAPSKWFRGRIDPRDLLPNSWVRVESSWIE